MNKTIKNDLTIQQSGNINSQSENYNNSCYIINDFSDGLIFGISGLIPFNDAIRRTNNKNLTKKQLYNLYINKNIKELASINFGEKYSDLSTNPVGREVLVCISGSSLNNTIGSIINDYNFKSIQEAKYNSIYFAIPTTTTLETAGYGASNNDADSELISNNTNNKKILNRYISNNMFKDMSKKKKYAFLINNNISKRIIDNKTFTTKNYCEKKNTNFNLSNINLNLN